MQKQSDLSAVQKGIITGYGPRVAQRAVDERRKGAAAEHSRESTYSSEAIYYPNKSEGYHNCIQNDSLVNGFAYRAIAVDGWYLYLE